MKSCLEHQNDGRATFTDKMDLSNSINSDSMDAEIAADFNNVAVSRWERNATSNEPMARVSNDNGQTFGPILKLSIVPSLNTVKTIKAQENLVVRNRDESSSISPPPIFHYDFRITRSTLNVIMTLGIEIAVLHVILSG